MAAWGVKFWHFSRFHVTCSVLAELNARIFYLAVASNRRTEALASVKTFYLFICLYRYTYVFYFFMFL